VVIPRTDYAATVWHKLNSTTQVQKLTTIQRIAIKAITGCLKTTSTTAMQFEAQLLPVNLRLKRQLQRYITRVQTLSENQPVAQAYKNALRKYRQQRKPTPTSKLEHLIHNFPEETKRPLETIRPYIRPPWRQPQANVQIQLTKKAAKSRHDEITCHPDPQTMYIYTDGSGINGHVGAAAYSPTLNTTSHQYLGEENSFNVFAAELTAIDLAMEMIKTSKTSHKKHIIFTDSQAATKAVFKPKRQSGQQIIQGILYKLETLALANPNLNLTIEWIPGHMDIPGNERADAEAKKAAKEKGKLGKPFQHRGLKSSQNQNIEAKISSQARKEWEEAETKEQFQKIIRKNPTKQSGSKYYNCAINRRQATRLVQLRTGHIPLNQYLHRFHIIDSPQCACGQGVETISHYILHCKQYMKQRSELRSKVEPRGMKLHTLLGDPKHAKAITEYVAETKRFV